MYLQIKSKYKSVVDSIVKIIIDKLNLCYFLVNSNQIN